MVNHFKKSFSYLRQYKGQLSINFGISILTALLEIISLASIIPFLDLIFLNTDIVPPEAKPESISWQGLPATADLFKEHITYQFQNFATHYSKVEILVLICVSMLAVFFFKNLLLYISRLIEANVRYSISKDFRNNIYQKVLDLPVGYFTDNKRGDLLNKFASDILKLEGSILNGYKMLLKQPVLILFYITAMLLISIKLTLFIFILLPVLGLVIGRISKSLKRRSQKAQEQMGRLTSMFDETLFGIKIIKAQNAEHSFSSWFTNATKQLWRQENQMSKRREASAPLSEFMGIAVVMLVLWYGGQLILGDNGGALTGSLFIGFVIIFSRLISPVKDFSKLYAGMLEGLANAERIEDLIATPNSITNSQNASQLNEFNEHIKFNNVSFHYELDQPVLNNLSFAIPKGHVIALVGESGAGKSTIADLIPRFYDVIDGEILIDNVDIREYSLESLRSQIAFVSQEAILFNDTVFNNIVFGDKNSNQEKAIEAAKVANAHEFISNLEFGYDTIIGERGGKLSGGQKQRLTIARAVYKNAPILILDEATSALDTESEKLVQDAISNLLINKTALIIAHRLSTIKNANTIFVLDKGEIVEQGNHASLIAKENGRYRGLFELQSL